MKRSDGALMVAGVGACAACCAGPVAGVLAAIGLGTLAGVLWFGAAAIIIGGLTLGGVVLGRRRRRLRCIPDGLGPVAVSIGRRPGG
jgi:mercuric ion transport protein